MREYIDLIILMENSNLSPGIIDGSALYVFKHGGCDALAIALHDATNWPIVAITDANNVFADGTAGGGSAMHWNVRHPSGKLLDIDGLHDVGELVDEYMDDADDGKAAAGISTRADAMEWYEEAGEKVPLKIAATFVEPLLASIRNV
jgi:hypothetical protein